MDTKVIYKAIYEGLILANTKLNKDTYFKLKEFDSKNKSEILKNAYLADKSKRPLCQDTGQVVIFIKIGQNVRLEGGFIEDEINKAVQDCYKENFYRKSVVKDAVFNRENTKDNTPCIIHTKFQKGDEISILIGIKGGGAENMTRLKMMNPTSSLEDIYEFVRETIKEAGEKACPPMAVGIGVGGTAEVSALYAKYALFKGKPCNVTFDNVFETKMISGPTHIASMPVCVNLNCHSLRHIEITIKDGKINYDFEEYKPEDVELSMNLRKINAFDIESLKNLKDKEKILLTGKIYTARDMAHKKLVEMIKNKEKLPIELKSSIIFYAGPCPKKDDEVIGPIGPTTSQRMDKFAVELYKQGVIATIGKGERTIKGTGYLYFKAIGGVACLYQKCVKSSKIAAFEELGTEAIRELEVTDMPLETAII